MTDEDFALDDDFVFGHLPEERRAHMRQLMAARIERNRQLTATRPKGPREGIIGMAEGHELPPGESYDMIGGRTSYAWTPTRLVFPKNMAGFEILAVKVSQGWYEPFQAIEAITPFILEDADWAFEKKVEIGRVQMSGAIAITIRNPTNVATRVNFAACGLMECD